MILDYGHNPAAVEMLVDLAQRLDVKGRRLAVVAAPGDRRDEDVQEIARFLCRQVRPLRLPPRRHPSAAAARPKSLRCSTQNSSLLGVDERRDRRRP